MYIKYTKGDSFGIWKISDDLQTQTSMFFSHFTQKIDTLPLDNILDNNWLDSTQIDILTREQVEEIIFIEAI